MTGGERETFKAIAGSPAYPAFRETLEAEVRRNTERLFNMTDTLATARVVGVNFALRHIVDSLDAALDGRNPKPTGSPDWAPAFD
ncbi:MAG: hypothetical protein FWG48_06965 [Oscillospiraceae bacterium]|nr:hypothetical protein [Oscillospiraceae bacterium]